MFKSLSSLARGEIRETHILSPILGPLWDMLGQRHWRYRIAPECMGGGNWVLMIRKASGEPLVVCEYHPNKKGTKFSGWVNFYEGELMDGPDNDDSFLHDPIDSEAFGATEDEKVKGRKIAKMLSKHLEAVEESEALYAEQDQAAYKHFVSHYHDEWESFASIGRQVVTWMNTWENDSEDGINGSDLVDSLDTLSTRHISTHGQRDWRAFAHEHGLSTWATEDEQ